jgi:hypothetical protein
MAPVLATVAPVFGIILLGFVVARGGWLGAETGKGLGDFAFSVALPCLLFRTMVTAGAVNSAPSAVLASFFLAAAATWLLATLGTRMLLRRPNADAASISIGATFGNTVMLGLPLGLSHFGEAASPAIALVLAVHAPVLWLIATLQIETTSEGGAMAPGRLRALAVDLARNPIVVGVVCGSLWRLTGLGLHEIPDRMLSLLGSAGIPASLFALGMSLTRFEIRGQLPTVALIMALKLLAMPVFAYLLAHAVFRLPPLETGAVVLLAACPTGANAFLFASRYDRAVGSVSAAIALGTAISALTVSLVLLVV